MFYFAVPPSSVHIYAGGSESDRSGGRQHRIVTLPEGQSQSLVCESAGSKPPASLAWKKQGKPIQVTDDIKVVRLFVIFVYKVKKF